MGNIGSKVLKLATLRCARLHKMRLAWRFTTIKLTYRGVSSNLARPPQEEYRFDSYETRKKTYSVV